MLVEMFSDSDLKPHKSKALDTIGFYFRDYGQSESCTKKFKCLKQKVVSRHWQQHIIIPIED